MLKSVKGMRVRGFWVNLRSAAARNSAHGSGAVKRGHSVTESELGHTDKSHGHSAQLSWVLRQRDWLQSTPGLAASDHPGITEKGFLLVWKAHWHKELCAVEGAHRAKLTALTCDCAIIRGLCVCINALQGSRKGLLLTAVCTPCVSYQVKSVHSNGKRKYLNKWACLSASKSESPMKLKPTLTVNQNLLWTLAQRSFCTQAAAVKHHGVVEYN